MSTTPTTNYGFSKITPGTEKDIWGPIQSTTLDGIDTAIKNRQDEAAAKLPLAGGTLTGKLNLIAGVTGNAPVKIPHGVAPTSPVDGDVWSTSTAFFVRQNGTTQQLSTAADLTAGLATKANTSHTHPESDITNLVSDLAAINAAIALKAPLAAPVLTGVPTAPTAAYDTNTTQLATTAYVMAAASAETQVAKTAAYTFILSDAGRMVTFNHATVAAAFTVPPNSTTAFPIGTRIDVLQIGAAQLSIAPGAGVTLNSVTSKRKLTANGSGASLWKQATDTWYLFGDLTT